MSDIVEVALTISPVTKQKAALKTLCKVCKTWEAFIKDFTFKGNQLAVDVFVDLEHSHHLMGNLRRVFRNELHAAVSVEDSKEVSFPDWDGYFFRTYTDSELVLLEEKREDTITKNIFEDCFPKRRAGEGPKILVEVGVWRNHFLPFIAKEYKQFLKNSLLVGIDSGKHGPNLKEFESLDPTNFVKESMPSGGGGLLKSLSFEYLASAQPKVYQHKKYKNLYVFEGKNLALDSRSKVFASLFNQRVDVVFLRRMFRYMDYQAVGQDIAPHTDAISIVDYNGYAYYTHMAPSREELREQLEDFDPDLSEEHLMYYQLLARRR